MLSRTIHHQFLVNCTLLTFILCPIRIMNQNAVKSGGENCDAVQQDACRPLVTFMAHPVNRFLSSFFQSFSSSNNKPCNMLYCNPGGNVSKKYAAGRLTPTEFAQWQPKSEIEHSFNLATWMMAVHAYGDRPTWPLSKRNFALRDDTQGRKLLQLAKKRLRELDFVGLASRYSKSMELMSWKLGIPLNKYCSCNVNIFKSKRQQRHPSDLSESTRLEILKDNALDLELYEEAVVIFEKQLEDYRRSVSSKVRTSFNCDLNSVKCRAHPSNPWILADKYKRKFKPRIQSGKHNECSYECSRECRLPGEALLNKTDNISDYRISESMSTNIRHDDDISAAVSSSSALLTQRTTVWDDLAGVSLVLKSVTVLSVSVFARLTYVFARRISYRALCHVRSPT